MVSKQGGKGVWLTNKNAMLGFIHIREARI